MARIIDFPNQASALRPVTLSEFVGQRRAVDILASAITAAKRRMEPLDHVLLQGPPGLGKTSLAAIIAADMCGRFRQLSGPMLQRAVDMAALLASIEENDIVFIDEIHRAHPAALEMTYTAMEDFRLDMTVGTGLQTRSVSLPVPRFTLIGATTRAGQLPRPMRERFGLNLTLELYDEEDMIEILLRSARLLALDMERDVARLCAARCRGTPRVANALLRRLRDMADNTGRTAVDRNLAIACFELLGLDDKGLEARERAYLDCLANRFRGGPAGIEALAAALGIEAATIEEDIEPWLIHAGFVERTARGRVLGGLATTRTDARKHHTRDLFAEAP
jgi:Holliday junction DNA helicase RuvB